MLKARTRPGLGGHMFNRSRLARFRCPANMPAAIAAYCKKTGQKTPATHGEYLRSIFESLAHKYAAVLDIFRRISPHPIERLHIIGGGSHNAFLNELTAKACGIPVIAGPAEASALGNLLIQEKKDAASFSTT